MADKFSARITGLRAARGKMSLLGSLVISENADEMEITVKRIEAETKRTVARKTADLLRTVNSEVEKSKTRVIGLVGMNKVYAKRLEDTDLDLRHRSRKGFIGKRTPALLPALRRDFTKISASVAKATKRAVRRAA